MKFAKALYTFIREIHMEYGPDCELVKVALNPKLFSEVVKELSIDARYDMPMAGDLKLQGVALVPCTVKKTFTGEKPATLDLIEKLRIALGEERWTAAIKELFDEP